MENMPHFVTASRRVAERPFRFAVVAAAAALLAACSGDAEPRERDAEPGGADAQPQLYSPPAGFALPFRASVPPGVVVDALPAESGDAIRFVGMSGDERDERAFLHFFVSPPGAGESGARELVHAAAESYRIPGDRSELQPVQGPAWAVETYPIRSRGTLGEAISGWVALGRHRDRWYHVVVQHPLELEEEFGESVERILDSWIWADGTRLGG